MKIALHQITSIKASFEDDLTAYRKAGWTAFEMSIDKARQYIQQHGINDFIKFVKDSGLKPIAATGHVVQTFAEPNQIKANEEDFRKKLDLMSAVECPLVVFGADGPSAIAKAPSMSEAGLAERDKTYREQLARFANQVAKLADMAKPKGVTMALEINWCSMCRSVVTAAEAIRLINRDNVGLLFDTAHFACTPSRLSDLDLVKGQVVAGHLNDMRNCPPEIRNVNNDRVIPGDGVLPLVAWINKVEECGFRGWHAVEIFCEDLWRESPLAIAQKVMKGCKRVWPEAEF
jgi:2-keto-myo-inositol isomerase